MSIIGLSMAALPCGAKEDVEAGSAALRVDWPVYPRRAEHNTVAEGGNRRLAEMDVAVVTVEGGLAKLPRARAFHRDSQDYVTKALPAPRMARSRSTVRSNQINLSPRAYDCNATHRNRNPPVAPHPLRSLPTQKAP